jgi:hypothetical protein
VNFHIEDEAIDDATHVIELGGEVDLYTAPEFKERMVELIESGKKHLRDHRARPRLPDPLLARRRTRRGHHGRVDPGANALASLF